MRILVVSQWFPPEPGGGPARFLEMARLWQERGHAVNVLAGLPNWPTGKIHDAYRGRLTVRESYQGIPVARLPVIPTRNEGALRRLVNHGSFTLSASVAPRRLPRSDVIVATTPPLFAPLAAVVRSRTRNIPYVLDVRDLWPDSIYTLSNMHSRWARRGLESVERLLYRRAAAVVVVTEGLAGFVRERGARRVETIFNGVDLEKFSPGPPDPSVRRSMSADGEMTFVYAGTLGLAHGLDTVLVAARQLASTRARFVFVGEGADRPRLERIAREMELDNVTFLPVQPRDRMPDIYRSADVCLVSLRPAPLFTAALPSKIFEIMGCGRPILAAVEGEAAELIARTGAGYVTTPGSAPSLVAAVRVCLEADDIDEKGRAARRAAAEFDRRSLALRYEALLAEVAAPITRR